MEHRGRKTKLQPAALLLTALLAAPLGAEPPVDQRRPAALDGLVDIENMAGSIRVTGWDKAEIAVSGRLGRHASGLQFSGGPNRTRIEVEVEGNPHGVHSDLDIKVPAGSRLRIDGFEATITVTGVTGTVKAETVNGAISLTGGAKDVDLQAGKRAGEGQKATGRRKGEAGKGGG